MGEEAVSAGTPHPIQGIVAFYPPVTFVNRHRNYETLPPSRTIPGAIIPKRLGDLFDACYFCDSPDPEADRRKPYASPIFADIGTFPSKILLITCEHDSLREASEELEAKLKTEGEGKIEVRSQLVKGVGHGWDTMVKKEGAPGWKERVDMYDEAAKFVHDVAAN